MKTEAKRKMSRAMPPKLQAGVTTERVQIVAPASWIELVDEWRRKQPKIPSRSEAIRIMVENYAKGLK